MLKLLFTEKDIADMIEAVLEEAKKAWGTNENLKEYVETSPIVENLLALGIDPDAVEEQGAPENNN